MEYKECKFKSYFKSEKYMGVQGGLGARVPNAPPPLGGGQAGGGGSFNITSGDLLNKNL